MTARNGRMTATSSCQPCQRDLNQFDLACLNCGRRYLRDIKARRLLLETKQEWLRKVLSDWMRHGHAEAELRATTPHQ